MKLCPDTRRGPAHRRWTSLLLALLFLTAASEQAVHAHRGMLPASKQISDTLDSNAAARCHICLHSKAAPLGSGTISISLHVTAEATVSPNPLDAHAPGEEWIHHVRPPPVV